MILPVTPRVEHVVWIVRGGSGTWRSIGRGCVGGRLEEAATIGNGRSVAGVQRSRVR